MDKRWVDIPLALAAGRSGSDGPGVGTGHASLLNPDWSIQAEPVQIADHLYQVGTATLTSFLITSEEGHILIDVPLDENVV